MGPHPILNMWVKGHQLNMCTVKSYKNRTNKTKRSCLIVSGVDTVLGTHANNFFNIFITVILDKVKKF